MIFVIWACERIISPGVFLLLLYFYSFRLYLFFPTLFQDNVLKVCMWGQVQGTHTRESERQKTEQERQRGLLHQTQLVVENICWRWERRAFFVCVCFLQFLHFINLLWEIQVTFKSSATQSYHCVYLTGDLLWCRRECLWTLPGHLGRRVLFFFDFKLHGDLLTCMARNTRVQHAFCPHPWGLDTPSGVHPRQEKKAEYWALVKPGSIMGPSLCKTHTQTKKHSQGIVNFVHFTFNKLGQWCMRV